MKYPSVMPLWDDPCFDREAAVNNYYLYNFPPTAPAPLNSHSTSIGVKNEPIYIHTDADTDFWTVAPSILGVIVAVAVGYFTLRVQKNQIRANLSTLRHQWMTELRGTSSEYLQVLCMIALRTEGKPGFKNSIEYMELYERQTILTCKFEMLLSRDDASTEAIFKLDQELCNELGLMQDGDDANSTIDKVDALKKMIRAELEDAWEDIQNDIGTRRRADSGIFANLVKMTSFRLLRRSKN